jgi:alanyl-tRNA synthetase
MDIYRVRMFGRLGFERRRCDSCGRFFWTLDRGRRTCGDSPCDEYAFLGNPPTRRSYELHEMEQEFLRFFEENGHTVIKRYPVVARWRDDIYLTIASIADFQPWVTSGLVPPPANPLVVSQPSIRLKDIDNVGRSGKHFTLFFMGGHHAFNTREKTIYWNHETVEYCHQFLTERLGIRPEEITYIEGSWEGGGNAGEDFEVNVRGLEVATLVFMRYAVRNGERVPLPLNIVDTGYGVERLTWLSRGEPTSYDSIFGPMVEELLRRSGVNRPPKEILEINSKLAGMMDVESGRGLRWLREKVAEKTGRKPEELDSLLKPLESVYAVADHLRCLAFMFGDGITPSNVAEGYLARLVLRRTIRLLREMGLEEEFIELMKKELEFLKPFPELWREREYILRVCELEAKRYADTLSAGERIVKRMVERGIDISGELLRLYDSQGLPPEIVQEICARLGVSVKIPEDFYIQAAKLHSSSPKVERREETEISFGAPPTIPLYYENPYLREFEAEVLESRDELVVLNQTAFYPEGGGQPCDLGELRGESGAARVLDVQKHGETIVHRLDRNPFRKGERVKGVLDWGRRVSLMRHHTATHILLGAARKVLGSHVWQHGAQKGTERTRLDVTHYQRITEEELREIERLANEIVMRDLPVICRWMDRNEAEAKYGFVLYQGGVVPGAKLRVVEIEGWNTQACAGTHCSRAGEVGPIVIVRTERIQDGVERLEFSAGGAAVKLIQERYKEMTEASQILRCLPEKLPEATLRLFEQWKTSTKELEKLRKKLAELLGSSLLQQARQIGGILLIARKLELGRDDLVKLGEFLIKTEPKSVVVLTYEEEGVGKILVMAGEESLKLGIHCGKIASELSQMAGGRGGGTVELGQGGGLQISRLEEVVRVAEEMIRC